MIYPKRKEKPIAYGICLGILAEICLHTSLISGILFLFYLGEYVIARLKEEKSWKSLWKDKKVCVTLILLAILYIFTIFILLPKGKLPNFVMREDYLNGETAVTIIVESMVRATTSGFSFSILAIVWLASIFVILFLRAKKERKIIVLFFATFAFLFLIYYNKWHIGILTQVILWIWYIWYQNQDTEKTTKFEKFFCIMSVVAILCIQIIWSIQALRADKTDQYCAGKYVAEYIREDVEEGKLIFGIDYSITAILPYYETNIFANYHHPEKSYYIWGTDEGRKEEDEYLLEADADIYVFSEAYYTKRAEIVEQLEEKGYKITRITSEINIKGVDYQLSGYIILRKVASI